MLAWGWGRYADRKLENAVLESYISQPLNRTTAVLYKTSQIRHVLSFDVIEDYRTVLKSDVKNFFFRTIGFPFFIRGLQCRICQ